MALSDRIPYQAQVDRPKLTLPGGKRLAVWVILNVEEWRIENAMPRTVLSPPMGQPLLPDVPNWSWHEYGMRAGFWRQFKALTDRKMPVTLAINANVCNSYPRVASAALDAGFATGLIAIADDSGLSVDVLGGAPGIFSARWAGRHGDDQANIDLLLAQLGDIKDEHRGASFVCAAALATPDGYVAVELGHLPGTLLRERRGHGGFGYDPILQPEGYEISVAELSREEKNAISHRGRAFRGLLPQIVKALADQDAK